MLLRFCISLCEVESNQKAKPGLQPRAPYDPTGDAAQLAACSLLAKGTTMRTPTPTADFLRSPWKVTNTQEHTNSVIFRRSSAMLLRFCISVCECVCLFASERNESMNRIIKRSKDSSQRHLANPAATLLSLPLALSLRKAGHCGNQFRQLTF